MDIIAVPNWLNGRKFMSDYINKRVANMSCLQRGTVIQSRRLSEYRCFAPMVLRLDISSFVK